MKLRRLGLEDFRSLADAFVRPYHKEYLAMYSSLLGGVVTHPFLMTIPLDDHMAHRGDAVFETFKCVEGNIYALDRHLDRLERSARSLHLVLPFPRAEIAEVVKETIRAGSVRNCLIRLFASRGPGGFTVNPYECPAPQLYVSVAHLQLPSEEEYQKGISLKSSSLVSKKPFFANVKSCNYLQNVLMKKEAVDAGVDYTISLDEAGFLAEGASENVAVVTGSRVLKLPRFARILKGTTVSRAMELLQENEHRQLVREICFEDITLGETYSSEEVLVFGTSFDVLGAVSFDALPIGTGKPGPVFRLLRELFSNDVHHNKAMLTPVFETE